MSGGQEGSKDRRKDWDREGSSGEGIGGIKMKAEG